MRKRTAKSVSGVWQEPQGEMNGTPASGCPVPTLNSIWATPWSGQRPNSSGHQVAVKPHPMEEEPPSIPPPSTPNPQFFGLQASLRNPRTPEHAPLPGAPPGASCRLCVSEVGVQGRSRCTWTVVSSVTTLSTSVTEM